MKTPWAIRWPCTRRRLDLFLGENTSGGARGGSVPPARLRHPRPSRHGTDPTKKLQTQDEWIARAREVLPAGGFGIIDPSIVIVRGEGARVWDEHGTEYVDYLIGSGPMLLGRGHGHGHAEVMEAVLEQLPCGMAFFANNAAGIDLADEILRAVPSAQQVRFVASGGEADMYASDGYAPAPGTTRS